MLLNEVKNKIKNKKIISFDIFDTLLLRPYVEPNDLFEHLGLLNNIDNFKEIRWNAFLDARKKYCINGIDEVTLDEIYEFIPQELQYIKEKEIELEKQILQQNVEIKKVWDYAKKLNKKVIVTSDMYSSKDILEDILRKNDYIPDEIFVSSEIKKLKAHKDLYYFVLDKLKCKSKDILHIGDNYNSDIQKAQEVGIDAIYYKKIIDKYFEMLPRARKFYEDNQKNVGSSIVIGTSALILHKNNILNKKDLNKQNYWEKIGIELGGPLAYTFMNWLNKQVIKDGIEELLFVARDGYSLQKVFKIINPDIKTYYIYSPRSLSTAITLDLDNIFSMSGDKLILNIVNNLINYFAQKYNTEVTLLNTKKEAIHYFESNKSQWQEYAKLERKEYENYFKNLGINKTKNIGFVDILTAFFSGQGAVSRIFPNVKGYYYSVREIHQDAFSNKFLFAAMTDQRYCIPLLESLITSPEEPVKWLKAGKPVYKSINKIEKERSKNYISISNGIVEFANEIKNIFQNIEVFFDSTIINGLFKNFEDNPMEIDKFYFLHLMHSWDVDHKTYKPIFPKWYIGYRNDSYLKIGGNMYVYQLNEDG